MRMRMRLLCTVLGARGQEFKPLVLLEAEMRDEKGKENQNENSRIERGNGI